MSGWDVPKMQVGRQKVRVARVKTEYKGQPMKTRAGVPCIRIVFESENGGDCENLYMLEGKAIFRLIQVLHACGHKKSDLEKAGVQPLHFHSDAVCQSYLVGHSFDADVSERENPQNVSEPFIDVTPVKPEELPLDEATKAANKAMGYDTPSTPATTNDDGDCPF